MNANASESFHVIVGNVSIAKPYRKEKDESASEIMSTIKPTTALENMMNLIAVEKVMANDQ